MDTVLYRQIQKGNPIAIHNAHKLISRYRWYALKNRGFIRQFCNNQANEIEKAIHSAK